MSFMRPEAVSFLSKWAEALIGLAVFALGLFWALSYGGILQWIGYAVIVIGIALTVSGIQRGRFKTGGRGAGFVQIDERRVTYFGPLSGGVINLEDLGSLAIDPSIRPAHWVLTVPNQPPLLIPFGAEGADDLFDVFAQLPDLNTEHLLQKMQAKGDHPVVIWRSADVQKSVRRLH